MKKKVIIFPGTLQSVKNYGDFAGVEIWMGEGWDGQIPEADVYIGHSLGASFALANCRKDAKLILFNPLVKKRSFFDNLWRWLRFTFFEGLPIKKVISVRFWFYTFRKMLNLLQVSVLDELKKIPRENIFIIRGTQDYFFCDIETVEIIRKNNFNLIEVEAGHADWNESVAKIVADIVDKK